MKLTPVQRRLLLTVWDGIHQQLDVENWDRRV
jgi:hypothetical protein